MWDRPQALLWLANFFYALAAVLLLVSAEFWMVCRLGQKCGQIAPQPTVPAPAISDLFAAK